MPQGREVLGAFHPHWFEWRFLTEMYSTCACTVDNISVQTIHRPKRLFIGFLKIQSVSRSKLGFTKNLQKSNSDFMKKSHLAATVMQG